MIISAGVNIYPAEIEDALHRHPDIQDAAVFGVPDDEWGERVHAAVQPRSGARLTADDVVAFARKHLAGYKVPREVTFHETFPRDNAGKHILEMQRSTPVEGLTVYRRNGVEAFTDTSTLKEVSKEADLPKSVMASIEKMARPAGPPMTGPLFQRAVETLKTQESIDNVNGQVLFTLHQPVANQERCQGCHGTDHKVRAVVRVATAMEQVLAAVRE